MNTASKSVLLIEPESVLAEVTAFRLELLGYSVKCVDSAEEALGEIANGIPDLLITDLVLPGLDGVGLIERLASDPQTSDLAIMVISIDADLARVEAIFEAGARDFLVVPFHMGVFEEKVSSLLAGVTSTYTKAKSSAGTVEVNSS